MVNPNSSINASAIQNKNTSIIRTAHNETQLTLDELLGPNVQDEDYLLELLEKPKKKSQLPAITATEKFALDLVRQKNWGANEMGKSEYLSH